MARKPEAPEELSLRGYATVTAADARQAVAALSHARMAIVIMNLDLPAASDARLIERLSGRLARMPVVVYGLPATPTEGVLSDLADALVVNRSDLLGIV